jgi:hypothetical protein
LNFIVRAVTGNSSVVTLRIAGFDFVLTNQGKLGIALAVAVVVVSTGMPLDHATSTVKHEIESMGVAVDVEDALILSTVARAVSV